MRCIWCAVAGHILELDKNQFISAFGIALAASGSMQFLTDGSWIRSHVGQADKMDLIGFWL